MQALLGDIPHTIWNSYKKLVSWEVCLPRTRQAEPEICGLNALGRANFLQGLGKNLIASVFLSSI